MSDKENNNQPKEGYAVSNRLKNSSIISKIIEKIMFKDYRNKFKR